MFQVLLVWHDSGGGLSLQYLNAVINFKAASML